MVAEIWPLLHDVGFRVARPAVWVKNAAGFNAGPDSKLSAQYEPFFYCRKGEAILQRRGIGDVFTHSRPSSKYRIHPTEKPVGLFEELVRTYSNKGDTVLDNCIGSGTTAVACIRSSRNFIGIDISKKWVDVSIGRIKDIEGSTLLI